MMSTLRFDPEDTAWVINPGFWAMCSIRSCSKWRFLAEVRHPDEVRRGFTCSNNNDVKYNSCEKPEQPWDRTRHTLEKKFNMFKKK